MTKQHFEMVARIIRVRTEALESGMSSAISRDEEALLRVTLRDIARDFANEFENANKQFNRERFLKACGILKEETGR